MLNEILFALPVLSFAAQPDAPDMSIADSEVLAPRSCDPNEDCSVCFEYPCPTWDDPGRMCEECPNDPVCLVRVEACKAAILDCVTATIGAVSAECAVCIYSVGWGTALIGCTPFCGDAIEAAAQNCI
ncbi:hypothetical protein [Nannocystis punicea]|uniref:Uncharacterized protein n=1 Tax=Nannocystis punicea TaxID=2995304 RepID=A0ABY7HBQ8_9BACT|nr:hypothetical protein [Nannocystis poenicansa]WAS96702.1 hypothetical protein O0S08_11175 [Nannocystis poenicansa]